MQKKVFFYFFFFLLLSAFFVQADWVRPSSGVAYGEFFIENNTVITTITSQGIFVNITSGAVGGHLKQVTYADGKLTAQVPGLFEADYSLSYEDGNNVEFETAIGINSLNQTNCHTSRRMDAGGDIGVIATSCFIRLISGDVVTLMIRNFDGTSNVIVEEANLNLIRFDD